MAVKQNKENLNKPSKDLKNNIPDNEIKEIFIGIDLGTSNCVVSCLNNVAKSDSDNLLPNVLDIPQVSGANQYVNSSQLPSFLYIPINEEDDYKLPWKQNSDFILGQFAKDKSQVTPDRVISSAKSWLCNNKIDRYTEILPWKSETVQNKFSPFNVTKHFLSHLKNSIESNLEIDTDKDSATQSTVPVVSSPVKSIVITVPASFDEVARSLTMKAATEAGLVEATLLEEPLAAFYDWIAQNPKWEDDIDDKSIVLVCDIGGGTSDFTLISVAKRLGELSLDRISVGDHILLGGDNMDLALSYKIKSELSLEDKNIDSWQFNSLIAQARFAKEKLLSDETLEHIQISIPSRGASLFATPISYTITKKLITDTIVEGFFPLCNVTEKTAQKRGVGLKEAGLDYALDPAFTKHLAEFLVKSKDRLSEDQKTELNIYTNLSFIKPTHVLFNGGVFNSRVFTDRIYSLLQEWCGGKIQILEGINKDVSVARGASFFAKNKYTGKGIKVKSGITASYYIGIESSEMAVPGYNPPLKGMCLLKKGTVEGTSYTLSDTELGLQIGSNVTFRFFSSKDRPDDEVGQFVNDASQNLEEISNLQANVKSHKYESETFIPVYLEANITDLGTMELWLKEVDSGLNSTADNSTADNSNPNKSNSDKLDKWLLEINVREN